MDHKSRSPKEHTAHAHSILKSAGYAHGGSLTPAKAVHKHEANMHKGQPETKFAKGGAVKGPKAVNVVVHAGGSNPGEKQQALRQGIQLGARMGAAHAAGAMQAPPRPPMGGPPGGLPTAPPGGMMAKGGIVKVRSHIRRKAGGKVDCE